MDIVDKLNIFTEQTGAGGMSTATGALPVKGSTKSSGATTTSDVARNLTKGNVDAIGGKCPNGQYYDKEKKVCVPIKKESIAVGGSYIGGQSSIASSGQTRAVGRYNQNIISLDRKEENPNLSLRFNRLLGAYVPSSWLTGEPDLDVDEY
jgi:hypothetical protein